MSEETPERREESERPAPTADPSWQQVAASFRWPLVLVVFALVAFFLYRETLKRADRVAEAVGGIAEATAARAERIARNFWTGDVTEHFVASIPEIAPTGHLELAKAEVTESVSRSDERRLLWDTVSLGTTVTEIKVPVTYRYHVRLDDAWRLEVKDHRCFVVAPTIRPTLPPAIHTHRMEKRVDRGWLRFDSDEQLELLQKSLTPRLNELAREESRVTLIREAARRSVAGFVRDWLVGEAQWAEEGIREVEVLFADEVEPRSEGPPPPG